MSCAGLTNQNLTSVAPPAAVNDGAERSAVHAGFLMRWVQSCAAAPKRASRSPRTTSDMLTPSRAHWALHATVQTEGHVDGEALRRFVAVGPALGHPCFGGSLRGCLAAAVRLAGDADFLHGAWVSASLEMSWVSARISGGPDCPVIGHRKRRRQVQGERRLAHPSFLIQQSCKYGPVSVIASKRLGHLRIANKGVKIVKGGAYGRPGSGPAAVTLAGGAIQYISAVSSSGASSSRLRSFAGRNGAA